jgi:hypothetical protein
MLSGLADQRYAPSYSRSVPRMSTSTPTLDQAREALAIAGAAGMKLQRDTIGAILRERHAAMVASCEASPTPAHRALVAELALLVFWVESLPCDPPPM